MRWLLIALLLGSAPAQAQMATRTVPLINNETKQQLGTATFSGARIYLRDKDGKHFATAVIERDGSRTLYDPDGKVMDRLATPNGQPSDILLHAPPVPQYAK